MQASPIFLNTKNSVFYADFTHSCPLHMKGVDKWLLHTQVQHSHCKSHPMRCWTPPVKLWAALALRLSTDLTGTPAPFKIKLRALQDQSFIHKNMDLLRYIIIINKLNSYLLLVSSGAPVEGSGSELCSAEVITRARNCKMFLRCKLCCI